MRRGSFEEDRVQRVTCRGPFSEIVYGGSFPGIVSRGPFAKIVYSRLLGAACRSSYAGVPI